MKKVLAEIAATPLYWVLAVIVGVVTAVATVVMGQGGHKPEYLGYLPNVIIMLGVFPSYVMLGVPLWLVCKKEFSLDGRKFDMKAFMHEWTRLCSPIRLLSTLLIVMLMQVFFSVFTSFKGYIWYITDFYADPMFAHFDQVMHFGRQPWEWLMPVFGNKFSIVTFDYIYISWFYVKFYVLMWQGLSLRKPEVRATFFIAYIMAWIVNGMVIATIFSSADPCYYSMFYPHLHDPYQGLMTFIYSIQNQHPLVNIMLQNQLMDNFISDAVVPGSGIAGFPSMHVSAVVTYFMLSLSYGRKTKIAFFLYVVAIMLGSVMLGWHYAADGYFSMLSTPLIWLASKKFVHKFRLWEPRLKKAA